MENIFRCVGLGKELGLGGTEFRSWQWRRCSLEAGLSGAYILVGAAPEQWSSIRVVGQGPDTLLVLGSEGRDMGCTLRFMLWNLAQFHWNDSNSPPFPTGVICACACAM